MRSSSECLPGRASGRNTRRGKGPERKLTAGTSYSTQDEYDTDYTRYLALVTEYNNYVDDLRQINEVYQYVLDHQSDREGVSGRIANSKVENLL